MKIIEVRIIRTFDEGALRAVASVTFDDVFAVHNIKFNWASKQLNNCEIYKLTVKNDKQIQGLVAIQDFPKDRAIYVNIAESAPHNMGKSKQYNGVGGHLFAVAAKRSMELGMTDFYSWTPETWNWSNIIRKHWELHF